MPRYFVYDKSGEIVHVHEMYDATSGLSLACTKEEIFEILDDTLDKNNLEILSDESESESARDVLHVDLKTCSLVKKE